MPKFVPTLFEGESLYSWLARWGLRSGMPSKRIALKYLIGENHLQLMSLLPSYAGILANLSGLSVKQLINEHSALPYYNWLGALHLKITGVSYSLTSQSTRYFH